MRFLTLITFVVSLVSHAFAITPTVLRCENRESPHRIDIAKPRLSWMLDSGQQSAYQIVVKGVWDSGKVVSDQSVAVEYAGPDLKSQTRYDWQVRVCDKEGVAGDWSPPGRTVTGVIGKPWQGKWIANPYGAASAKGIGYHAGEATTEEVKWVQVDLGKPQPIESVVTESLRHDNRDGFGFPLRYKIEGSNDPEFSKPLLIANHTQNDVSSPGNKALAHPAKVTARYVRVTATKLYPWNNNYTYTLKADSKGETWFPQFFYRGGRYLQVELSAPEGKPLPEITDL